VKNMGIITRLMMKLKPSMLVINEAISSPMQTSPIEMRIIVGISITKDIGDRWTPTKNESGNRIAPWMRALVPLPSALPMTIEVRETGATIISLKKPNSLSHIMEIPEKTEVNKRVMPIMPGNM